MPESPRTVITMEAGLDVGIASDSAREIVAHGLAWLQ